MKQSDDSTMFKSIMTGILLTAFGSSIGFGISQMTVTQDFKAFSVLTSSEIAHLKKADFDLQKTIDDMRIISEERMKDVIDLIKSGYVQNQELINLIKVQNEMLRQQHNNKP